MRGGQRSCGVSPAATKRRELGTQSRKYRPVKNLEPQLSEFSQNLSFYTDGFGIGLY